jgi:hypothetical protein
MSKFDTWRRLIDYARFAPSPHNVQAWLFKLESDTKALLMYDPHRLLPGTDPTTCFSTAGFGILLEMLSIAAAGEGLDVNVQYLGARLDYNAKGHQPYANLELVARTQPEKFDRKLILERRTSRLPYLADKPVELGVLEELAQVAESFGHKLEFSTDAEQVNWIVRLNADTMFYDMTDPIAQNELGKLFRYSIKEADGKRDGLAAHTMCFPGPLMKFFVKHNWLFRLPGIYQLTRKYYQYSMRGTSTVAWLSGPFETLEDWDRAGRLLARLWLTMTAHGIYLHPFGSVITNEKSHQQMVDHFSGSKRDHDLWLLVRLGHSAIPPKAQRLSVDELIVS